MDLPPPTGTIGPIDQGLLQRMLGLYGGLLSGVGNVAQSTVAPIQKFAQANAPADMNPSGLLSMLSQPLQSSGQAVTDMSQGFSPIQGTGNITQPQVNPQQLMDVANASLMAMPFARAIPGAVADAGRDFLAGIPISSAVPMRKALADAAAPAANDAPFPQFAEKYPPIPKPVEKIDSTSGEPYLGKGESPTTKAFMKARRGVQKDIEAGNYTPYFDPAQRFDADPANYPTTANTLTDTLPKKQATIDKHTAAIQTPDAAQRLNAAFDAGTAAGGNDRWYQMGQLEKAFTDELGPEAGQAAFKQRFADAMAATTGGADPTSNLLMAHYGNYLNTNGMKIPNASYKMPVPIGGRFVTGNMAQYGKMIDEGGIPVTNEKRFNFSRNFLGDTGPSTIDEQMTNLMSPGKNAPDTGQYGIYQDLLNQQAATRGIAPRDFQDVAWGGKKFTDTGGKYQGKPMIQHVNEAIERTSRLTGLSPQDVVRRGLVRGEIPLYGLMGAIGLGAGASPQQGQGGY